VEQTTHISPHQAGTLAECKTEMGKVVKKDDVLCLVRTNGNAESVVEVKSPVDGVIISDFAKKGDKVDSITSLHTVADLSKLLATFDVYERDIAKIKTGQRIVLHSVAYPDKTFEGEIIYVSPRVDEHTNTVKIRAEVFNPEYLLKLGMFVTAEVIIESNEDYVVVPQEAVHIVGDKRVVFIKTGEHDFDVRVVTVKIESKDASAIEGVKEGEVVVAQDGFLLKSELLKSQMGEGCAE
jgi:cobalt-zinc-cadmium efflux system membrane fusion protein